MKDPNEKMVLEIYEMVKVLSEEQKQLVEEIKELKLEQKKIQEELKFSNYVLNNINLRTEIIN